MDKQDLYKLDEILYKQIQDQKKQKEAENKAFFDGMEKGADLMMKAVRDFLTKEEENKPQEPTLTIVGVRFNNKTGKTYDYEYIGEKPVQVGDTVIVETEYQGATEVEVVDVFQIKESQAIYDYKTAKEKW